MIPNPDQSTNSSVTALLKSFCSFLRNVAVDRSKHRVSVNINFQNYLSGERSLIKSGPQTSDSGGRCTSAVLSGARARVACRADRPRLILSRISRSRRPTVKFDGSPSRMSERESDERGSIVSQPPACLRRTNSSSAVRNRINCFYYSSAARTLMKSNPLHRPCVVTRRLDKRFQFCRDSEDFVVAPSSVGRPNVMRRDARFADYFGFS